MDTPSRSESHGNPVQVSEVLEDRWDAGKLLWGPDGEGESGRRNCLALDVAVAARRTGVTRAVAVTGVLLVAAGVVLPSDASAQTPAQGQAVGILFLLGASKAGSPAGARPPGQKPKPSTPTSHETEGRIAGLKQKSLPVRDGTMPIKVGGETAVSVPAKVARPSDPLDGAVLRVTSDQTNGRKPDRPVELTGRTQAKHN